MFACVNIGIFKSVSLCIWSKHGRKQNKIMNGINWGKKSRDWWTEAGLSPDHQTWGEEMRNKEVGTCYRSWPNIPLICTSASVPRHHTASALVFSLMWFHVRSQHLPFCVSFSHCLMALEPAMLPWEPVGDSSAHYIYSLSSLFWKWIKCFLFRLAWKICPDSSPEVCTFKML